MRASLLPMLAADGVQPLRRARGARWMACAGMVLLLGATACASAPQLEGNLYRGEGFSFRFDPPDDGGTGWRRLDHSHALAYRNDGHQASILVHGRCDLDSDDVPLVALKNHLFLQFTDREVHTEEVVPFDGREALHTELTAKLDGVPMRYDVWVLKKDGCVFDLLYAAPPEQFASGHGTFQRMVDGFATVEREGAEARRGI